MNKQLALAIQLNDEATLSDFCWKGNPLLEQQLSCFLSQTGERFLYLWGSNGSGKSHLLQACCQGIQSTESAIYLPLNILHEMGPELLDGLEEQDLIALDDIHAIAGLAEWEEAIFHLYNRVRDKEKPRLIISGSVAPKQLSIQLPDLESRLSWGLVVHLNELNEQDKIDTLRLLAKKRGFDLSIGVVQFLLNRCARNMHDLQGLLNKLDEASLRAQRKITIPFVKEILGI
ncbi:DnaA regulatory inactivator Hda [Legionella impletisoli]|uniref:DnaA regulatory inactivator Hda n=1 Tax=Legionella impletisoli TaxID=343510 RepID=A0A917NAS7_9GAMM|nr:DnaA regulatory inactivator Hda [Legionella impletisoli]GGI84338.1 DnaA regulatory inactivator Hda [Legionella impletisoli]